MRLSETFTEALATADDAVQADGSPIRLITALADFVLLHDYFEGRDFASKRVEFQTLMKPITKANVEQFHAAISNADWNKVDFRALADPGDGDYVFDSVKTLESLAR